MLPIPKHQRRPESAYSALQCHARACAETVHGKEKAAGVTSTKRLPNLSAFRQLMKGGLNEEYHKFD
jgi:hypothetical protein